MLLNRDNPPDCSDELESEVVEVSLFARQKVKCYLMGNICYLYDILLLINSVANYKALVVHMI